MKTIRRIFIFIITSIFVISAYFTFGVKAEEIGGISGGIIPTVTEGFDVTAQLTVTDNFKITFNVARSDSSYSIYSYYYTYYVYDESASNHLRLVNSGTLSVQMPMQEFGITVYIEAPVLYENIMIYANGHLVYYCTAADVIIATRGLILSYSDGKGVSHPIYQTAEQMLCDDLLIYGKYAADYFGVNVATSIRLRQTEIDKISAITSSDTNKCALSYKSTVSNVEKLRITGLNFDCSSKCKTYVFLSANDGTNFSNYTYTDGTKNYQTEVLSDGRLKITVEFMFSELTSASKQIIINDSKGATVLTINVYGASYSHIALKKYDNKDDELTRICRCLYAIGEVQNYFNSSGDN